MIHESQVTTKEVEPQHIVQTEETLIKGRLFLVRKIKNTPQLNMMNTCTLRGALMVTGVQYKRQFFANLSHDSESHISLETKSLSHTDTGVQSVWVTNHDD